MAEFPLFMGLPPVSPHGNSVATHLRPFLADLVSDVVAKVLQEVVLVLGESEEVLLYNNDLFEELNQVVECLPQIGMERVLEVHLSGHVVSNAWDVAVLCHGCSHFIGHVTSFWVADPAMDSSSSGENPQATVKAKVVLKHIGQKLCSHIEIAPALLADLCTRAACPNIIISVHIDIKDHLFLHWDEGFLVSGEMPTWRKIEDCSDINFVWNSRDQVAFKFLSCLVA